MGSNHRNRSIQPSLPLSRNTFWLFLIPLPSSDTCSISASSFSHTEDTFLLKLPLPQGKGKVLSHCSPTHVETLLFCRGALQLVPQPKTLAWRNILENQIILVERTNSTAFKKTPARTTPPTKTSPIWPAACSRMQTFTSEPDRGWNTMRKHLQEEFFCHNILWMLLLFQHNRTEEKRKQHCQLYRVTSGTMQARVSSVLHRFWKLPDKNKLRDPLVTSTRTYRNKLFASSWVEYTFKFRLLKEIIK